MAAIPLYNISTLGNSFTCFYEGQQKGGYDGNTREDARMKRGGHEGGHERATMGICGVYEGDAMGVRDGDGGYTWVIRGHTRGIWKG